MVRIHLKEWRQALGVSVRVLEARSEVSLASIVRVEGGRQDPTVGLLGKLTEALGIEVVDLFRPPEKGDQRKAKPKRKGRKKK